MRLIAHRGFDDEYPPNTVAAVKQAAPQADMIELDVHRCGSGELVVAHNEIVDIDLDGVGEVGEFTAAELADLDAHEGEGIQTLEEVLDAIPAEIGVNCELKEAECIGDTLQIARDAPNYVIISSFDAETVHKAREDSALLNRDTAAG